MKIVTVIFGVAAVAMAAPARPTPPSVQAIRAVVESQIKAMSPPTVQAQCQGSQRFWKRDRHSGFCADKCTADYQCSPYEKCHIMGKTMSVANARVKSPKKFKAEYTSDRPLKPGEFGLCDPFYVEPTALSPDVAPPPPPGAVVDALTPEQQRTAEGR